MKTDALSNSKLMLEMPSFEDVVQKRMINEFLKEAAMIEGVFIEPFKRELDSIILQKEGQFGVELVIKHYINELLGANAIFNENKQILADYNYIGLGSSEYAYPQIDDRSGISDFDKYIIISYYIFNCHFYTIQEACVKNQIDFFELCRYVHFSWDMISTGITRIYNETSNLSEVTKNISDNTPIIQSFPEYIQNEQQNEVAELCKELFSIGHSPKKYAIMFCLLSDKGLITVPDRKRNSYYRAWYLYINTPFPKNNNFYAINKFLFDSTVNGFMFENTSDLDYLQLEKTFNEKLKIKNLQ